MSQICQCDLILKTVTGRTNVDNSHTYQISLHCPFDYCLPYSSHPNLSNPDSQCQFNRTGVLCGRCKEDLSVVFGTSQCKQCSNYYLFLLLLFILVGFAFIIIVSNQLSTRLLPQDVPSCSVVLYASFSAGLFDLTSSSSIPNLLSIIAFLEQ